MNWWSKRKDVNARAAICGGSDKRIMKKRQPVRLWMCVSPCMDAYTASVNEFIVTQQNGMNQTELDAVVHKNFHLICMTFGEDAQTNQMRK